VWALAGRAEALRMLGRTEASLDPYRRALELAPDHAFAVLGLAAALSEIGRHAEALPLWERALALRPASGFASDGLAQCQHALASSAP
jgi:tetratricopeptide (TPR) repeat protein